MPLAHTYTHTHTHTHTSVRPTGRYGQLHIVRVCLQTLDNDVQKAGLVEHRQRLAAALADNTMNTGHMKNTR